MGGIGRPRRGDPAQRRVRPGCGTGVQNFGETASQQVRITTAELSVQDNRKSRSEKSSFFDTFSGIVGSDFIFSGIFPVLFSSSVVWRKFLSLPQIIVLLMCINVETNYW